VNDALRLKQEHDRRLRGVDDFISAFEAEYGEIGHEEMEAAYRASKARAIVVRGGADGPDCCSREAESRTWSTRQ
jgi:hypothetical protein